MGFLVVESYINLWHFNTSIRAYVYSNRLYSQSLLRHVHLAASMVATVNSLYNNNLYGPVAVFERNSLTGPIICLSFHSGKTNLRYNVIDKNVSMSRLHTSPNRVNRKKGIPNPLLLPPFWHILPPESIYGIIVKFKNCLRNTKLGNE